jgi:asparagine synthase (glutamine-hydrolysing)
MRRRLAALAKRLPYAAYGKNFLHMIGRDGPLARYFELNYTPNLLLEGLLKPEWLPPADSAALTQVFADCLPPGEADILTQVLYFETAAKLTGDMLVKIDRMSMANSLEVRCPLLDHRLAAFAATIPHRWKMSGGRGKAILLDAVGDRLPEALRRRRKMGFGVPLAVWFRGPLRQMLWDCLTSAAFLDRGFVSPPFVRRLLIEHQSARRDNTTQLWALLMLELWRREWLN